MRRTILKSRIHRATVTEASPNHEGSLTIDQNLLDAADILPHEQIHVWNLTNGARLISYAVAGERGSGVVSMSDIGANLIHKGDIVIIATFTTLKSKEARKYRPAIVHVDGKNRIMEPPMPPGLPMSIPTPEGEESTKEAQAPETVEKVKPPRKRKEPKA